MELTLDDWNVHVEHSKFKIFSLSHPPLWAALRGVCLPVKTSLGYAAPFLHHISSESRRNKTLVKGTENHCGMSMYTKRLSVAVFSGLAYAERHGSRGTDRYCPVCLDETECSELQDTWDILSHSELS